MTTKTEDWQSELKKYEIDPEHKAQVREKFNFRPFKEAAAPTELPKNIVGLEGLDFSKFQEGPEGLEGRKELAAQLEEAVTEHGFFKILNFGISQEIIDQILSLSQGTFDEPQEVREKFVAGEHNLPEEKDKPLGPIRGSGYKPLGHWRTNGIPDNIDIFNFRHFTHYDTFFNRTQYPEFVKANLDDIAYYFNFIHREVLRKVAILLDIILELPEGTIYRDYFSVKPEQLTNSPDGFGRFLLYHPVSEDYKKKTNDIWLSGHTDGGALTFILSQPILSLQVQDYDTKEWRYVSHTPGALVVNIADQLRQLSGGYFKSSVHRVVTAPDNQKNYHRNTAIYFSNVTPRAYLDVDELKSPKLKRLGITYDKSVERLTAAEWDDLKGEYFNNRDKNWYEKETIRGRESIGSLREEKIPAVGITTGGN
ncbi:DEKNAAC102993 [Brettanomyces naardenensis]|uniref:DEKNAAC102993 n=1 Tax=Brettanomyces naardenensis TaxID=13370 RepID=A0A448YM11_BRENA|nr:DEKNAAC102993 [Brettanomyces naardenensis]